MLLTVVDVVRFSTGVVLTRVTDVVDVIFPGVVLAGVVDDIFTVVVVNLIGDCVVFAGTAVIFDGVFTVDELDASVVVLNRFIVGSELEFVGRTFWLVVVLVAVTGGLTDDCSEIGAGRLGGLFVGSVEMIFCVVRVVDIGDVVTRDPPDVALDAGVGLTFCDLHKSYT